MYKTEIINNLCSKILHYTYLIIKEEHFKLLTKTIIKDEHTLNNTKITYIYIYNNFNSRINI